MNKYVHGYDAPYFPCKNCGAELKHSGKPGVEQFNKCSNCGHVTPIPPLPVPIFAKRGLRKYLGEEEWRKLAKDPEGFIKNWNDAKKGAKLGSRSEGEANEKYWVVYNETALLDRPK